MREQAKNIERPRVIAYVGIGANLGDRAGNIRSSVAGMGEIVETRVMVVSSSIENPAVGGPPDSPPFLNAAAKLETGLSARELLAEFLKIERRLGRHRRTKWEPRPIDLDLLLYGDDIIRNEFLIVPHPLMHHRKFVLQPLAEIAPQAIHPLLQVTITDLLNRLSN